MESKKAHSILRELKRIREGDDTYSGKVFCSMSTSPLEVTLKAYELFHDTNVLDKYLFPGVCELEGRVISEVGSLLGLNKPFGYVTSGGSESNLVALWVAKKQNPGGREVVLPESAHYSLHRAADLMGLKIISVEVDEMFKVKVDLISDVIGDKTLCVCATAGTTDLGKIDPIRAVADLCLEENIFFHVDASFGGFVIPYLRMLGYGLPEFDFSVRGVKSMSVDPHKMGFAPIPAGAILMRDGLIDEIEYKPEYLSNTTNTLFGSRSGAPVAAVWAVMNYLGDEGYKMVVGECMRLTLMLYHSLSGMDGIQVIEPELNIVSFSTDDGPLRVKESLEERGWKIGFNYKHNRVRLVVMPHNTEEFVNQFLMDLDDILRRLK